MGFSIDCSKRVPVSTLGASDSKHKCTDSIEDKATDESKKEQDVGTETAKPIIEGSADSKTKITLIYYWANKPHMELFANLKNTTLNKLAELYSYDEWSLNYARLSSLRSVSALRDAAILV